MQQKNKIKKVKINNNNKYTTLRKKRVNYNYEIAFYNKDIKQQFKEQLKYARVNKLSNNAFYNNFNNYQSMIRKEFKNYQRYKRNKSKGWVTRSRRKMDTLYRELKRTNQNHKTITRQMREFAHRSDAFSSVDQMDPWKFATAQTIARIANFQSGINVSKWWHTLPETLRRRLESLMQSGDFESVEELMQYMRII